MLVNLKLNDIALFQSGIFEQTSPNGDALYLQANYFTDQGFDIAGLKPNIKLDPKKEKHLLTEGDILFGAKGHKNIAVVFRQAWGKAVASSTFIVLRLKPEYQQVLPEFVVWYLGLPALQNQFKTRTKGMSLPSISIKTLSELEITIPDLEKQKRILKIAQLRQQELEIKARLEAIRTEEILNLLTKATHA